MSVLTEEWILKTKDNCVKYIMWIRNFDKKVKTNRIGREIYSKHFKIGTATFQVGVYPGGDVSENADWVSVYLLNKSDSRVRANAKFSVQRDEDVFSESFGNYYQADVACDDNSWGFGKFVPQSKCIRNDLLDSHGLLTLQVDVELLEEEVHIQRSTENLGKTIKNQTSEMKSLCERIEKSETKTEELKDLVKELLGKTTQMTQQVECPVCMEVVRPPMRLKQCGQGHIICDSCHSKTNVDTAGQRRGCEEENLCHSCRGIITGRPSQLEKILGLS